MYTVNILNTFIPELSGVAFDGEFGYSLRTSSKITDYPLENGFQVVNGVIQMPTRLRMKLSVGAKVHTSTLVDPVSALTNSGDAIVSELASQLIDDVMVSYAFSIIKDSLFKAYSRGGETMAKLQAVQIAAEPFDVVIHGAGVLKGVLIESIELAQQDGDHFDFDVALKQIPYGRNPRKIEQASNKVDMGEAKVTYVG